MVTTRWGKIRESLFCAVEEFVDLEDRPVEEWTPSEAEIAAALQHAGMTRPEVTDAILAYMLADVRNEARRMYTLDETDE